MSIPSIAHIIRHWQKTIDRIDVELIIGFVLKKERTFVLAHDDLVPSQEQYARILDALHQRSCNVPLAYITKQKEFYGRTFYVDHHTLVPRPETELFIPAIMQLPSHVLHDALIIDIGTGSGIIAITLAKEFLDQHARTVPHVIATDISFEALHTAKHNARAFQVDHDIHFFRSDLLHNRHVRARIASPQCSHIIIAANLPYVDSAQKEILLTNKESHALRHEPDTALWSCDHGLSHYKKLTKQILYMKNNMPQKKFFLFYEIVPEQRTLLDAFLSTHNIAEKSRSLIYDLAHKPRIFSFSI